MRIFSISKSFCSAEQSISAANWDKNSTWEALRRKSNIKPWSEDKTERYFEEK